MVTLQQLKNVFEIAEEEITTPDDISKEDLEDFQTRVNGLLDTLKDECEGEEEDPDA